MAQLYDVQTREINQAVRNNPDKFPEGYVFELDRQEFNSLRSKILTANNSDNLLRPQNAVPKFTKTRVLPKAFTEKGLYMLATILKSPKATQTTIAIVETFAQLRELLKKCRR